MTLPALHAGQTLSLLSTQLSTNALALAAAAANGGGTLYIQGDIANDANLGQVADPIRIAFSGASVAITGAYALTAKAQAISGHTITSAADTGGLKLGTVVLADMAFRADGTTAATDGYRLGGNVDLSHVSANIDLQAMHGLTVTAGKIGDLTGAITLNPLVSGQSLIVAAGLLTGDALSLTGAAGSLLDITGDLNSAGTIDLTSVSGASISFKDTPADTSNSIALTNGGNLKLGAALADGLTVTSDGSASQSATGTVLLNGHLVAAKAINLGNVTANIDLRGLLNLNVGSTGVFTDTSLTAATIAIMTLAAGQTLSVSSDQLSGTGALKLHGNGTLYFAGNITAATDLTGIDSTVGIYWDYGWMVATTLTATAAQLDWLDVTGSDSTVIIKGSLSANTNVSLVKTSIDLTQLGVTAGIGTNTFESSDGNTLSIGSFLASQSLIVTASQANMLQLTGAGTLVVEYDIGNTTLTRSVNLYDVATNINLTHLTGLTPNASGLLWDGTNTIALPSLGSSQTLTVLASQLASTPTDYVNDYITIVGDVGSTVNVQGNIASGQAADIRDIQSTVAISFADSGELTPTIAVDGQLYMTVAQASGKSVTGSGMVLASADIDGSVVADLTGLKASNSVLLVNANVTITPDGSKAASTVLGTVVTEVLSWGKLTGDAAIFDGRTVKGEGTLVLTGNANNLDLGGLLSSTDHVANLDIRQVSDGAHGASGIFTSVAASNPAHYSVTVGSNQTLYLTGAQLSGNEIHSASTTANVHSNAVVDAQVGGSYDFSHVTAFSGGNLLTLSFTDSGAIAASNSDLLHFNQIDLHNGGGYSITAAQADGITWSGGAGGIAITDVATVSHSAYSLSGTTSADSFTANGKGELAVNMSQGGDDTLVFSGLKTHDFTVAGFAIDATGATGDYLNFHNLNQFTGNTAANYTVVDIGMGDGTWNQTYSNSEVIVLKDAFVSTASGLADLFNSPFANVNNKLAASGVSKEIFMAAGSDGNANIWLWQDTGDHKVQATELFNLGTLSGVTYTDLSNLQSSHILG